MNRDLFGETPDERSIGLLRAFEADALSFDPRGFALAFSGGKDSTVLLSLARRAGVAFTAHYASTTVDPPEVFRFIKREYPEVEILRPPLSFFQLVVKKGLPTRRFRFCCADLKERAGDGRMILTGVRDEESPRRASRLVVESCTKRRSMFLHPIKSWKEAQVWEYIKEHRLPYPSLYDEGFRRIGCVVCPFERRKERSMARWPHLWAAARRAAHKRFELRADHGYRERYGSPEGYWRWWLLDMAAKSPENQCLLFEGGSA